MSIRLQGLLAFVVGTLIEVGYVTSLINAAENGADELAIWKSVIFVSSAVMALGLFFLACGESSKRLLESDNDNLSPAHIAVLAVSLVFSVIAYALVMNRLGSLGYS
jgi:hypothetical protein